MMVTQHQLTRMVVVVRQRCDWLHALFYMKSLHFYVKLIKRYRKHRKCRQKRKRLRGRRFTVKRTVAGRWRSVQWVIRKRLHKAYKASLAEIMNEKSRLFCTNPTMNPITAAILRWRCRARKTTMHHSQVSIMNVCNGFVFFEELKA